MCCPFSIESEVTQTKGKILPNVDESKQPKPSKTINIKSKNESESDAKLDRAGGRLSNSESNSNAATVQSTSTITFTKRKLSAIDSSTMELEDDVFEGTDVSICFLLIFICQLLI